VSSSELRPYNPITCPSALSAWSFEVYKPFSPPSPISLAANKDPACSQSCSLSPALISLLTHYRSRDPCRLLTIRPLTNPHTSKDQSVVRLSSLATLIIAAFRLSTTLPAQPAFECSRKSPQSRSPLRKLACPTAVLIAL
jgi:hypothetical protein